MNKMTEVTKKLCRQGKTTIYSVVVFLSLVIPVSSGLASIIDVEKLANAIYYAEGGANTKHPYGILAKYKTTTPRQACINTINSALRRYAKTNQEEDFIVFLGKTYCPVGAANDPTDLNKNWVKNVTYFYNQNGREE